MRTLLLLVPGYDARQPGWARDRLAAALSEAGGGAPPREARLAGRPIQRVAVDDATIDLLEVAWADTATRGGDAKAVRALLAAPGLIGYWLLGLLDTARRARLRDGAKVASTLVVGLGGGAAVLVLWVGLVAWLALAELKLLDKSSEGSGLGLLVALIVGLGMRDGLAELITLGAYVRDYLRARPGDRLRALPRMRLADAVALGAEEGHDRILVVSHSHGSVISLDAVARGLPATVHLVTLGSPLIALRAWADWLDPALDAAFKNRSLSGWTDLHAPTDWLCGPVPGQAARFGDSHRIDFDAPWTEKLLLRTHARYLDDPVVAARIARLALRPADA